jgi:hypothetical protein
LNCKNNQFFFFQNINYDSQKKTSSDETLKSPPSTLASKLDKITQYTTCMSQHSLSLKNIRPHSYKPIPRRQFQPPTTSAPWLAQGGSSNDIDAKDNGNSHQNILSRQIADNSVEKNTNGVTQGVKLNSMVNNIDDIDGNNDDDDDEIFDPFASNKNNNSDNDSSDDDNNDSDDDDSDDEQAQLMQALALIQQEQKRDAEARVKIELGSDSSQLKQEIVDAKLLSNPLLASKMTHIVKTEQDLLNGEQVNVKVEDGGESNQGTAQKRSRWLNDTLFSNTALGLGDHINGNKRQRLNNDTINSDKHQEFMKGLFK